MSRRLDARARLSHFSMLRHHHAHPGSTDTMSTAQESVQDLRFPVGKFQRPAELDAQGRAKAIEIVAAAPARLREAVRGLTPEQIDTPYRPDGWTVRQVAHHVADSHMNAYIRFKL